MLELPFHIVRSRPISGSELIQAVECLRTRCRRHDFVTRADNEIHGFPLRVHVLPPLNTYQRVIDVTLMSEARDPLKCDAFVLMTEKTHALSASHAWTTWHVAESNVALEGDGKYDLNISAGLRKEGYFSGVYIYRPSPGSADVSYRRCLFDRVIAEMGIADTVFTRFGDDVLYLGAAAPWQLVYPSYQVSGGGNPLGFYACGFGSIEEAISAGQSLVDRFAKRVFGVSFVTMLPGESYNAVFSELNALWNFWDIDVMGALTPEAIDILKGGEVSNASPSRIPAIEWYGAKGWAAYGSVVVENSNRYLEIATFGGTLDQLKDRIAFLADLKFEFI